MELRIAAALKQPGKAFHAVIEQAFEKEAYGSREITFAAPVKLQFKYSFDGKAFMLIGHMEVALCSCCARCAEPFTETLHIPFSERFVKGSVHNGSGDSGSVENEEDSYVFDGETLSLSQPVLDNLFLHLPIQSVCKENCRGLCPVCGVNRNQVQCTCQVEQFEAVSPLSTLGELLNDDKEV